MTNSNVFGYELILDLYDCDSRVIRSGPKLKKFVAELCRIIKMRRYGPTLVEHFGHRNPLTSGYSIFQFIETSAISGHFSELTNNAYLNIFSCKKFNSGKVNAFCRKFFSCKKLKNIWVVRK